MGLRLMVILFVSYVIQLTLYYVATITFNVTASSLLGLPTSMPGGGGSTPGLGAFLSSINVELQAGLAVEGLVILGMFFVAAFRSRGDQTRL